MTNAEATAELDRLFEEHPEVVEATIASALIASPLAGPVRLLAEVRSVLELEA